MPNSFHANWRDADPALWLWPSFSSAEIACRGIGRLLIDKAALDRLQTPRGILGKLLIVSPAHWSSAHHHIVGGAAASRHV